MLNKKHSPLLQKNIYILSYILKKNMKYGLQLKHSQEKKVMDDNIYLRNKIKSYGS